MKLKEQVAIITGGNSGLGKSIAELMSEKGVEVHVCSRSKPKEVSKNITYHVCDVTHYDELDKLVQKIGDVSILINAAGAWLEGDFYKYSQAQIDEILDTNLKGLIYSSRAVLPVMMRQKYGVIVNVSSSSGLKGKANETVYAASKWGVRGFTDSLRDELKGSDIRIIGVYPGGMATPFFENGGSPKDNNDWMNPDEVAKTVLSAIENDNTLSLDHLQINRS